MKQLVFVCSIFVTLLSACSNPDQNSTSESKPVTNELSETAKALVGKWKLESMLMEYADGQQADFESGEINYYFQPDQTYMVEIVTADVLVTGKWMLSDGQGTVTLYPEMMNQEPVGVSEPMPLIINVLNEEEFQCQSNDPEGKSIQHMTFSKSQ